MPQFAATIKRYQQHLICSTPKRWQRFIQLRPERWDRNGIALPLHVNVWMLSQQHRIHCHCPSMHPWLRCGDALASPLLAVSLRLQTANISVAHQTVSKSLSKILLVMSGMKWVVTRLTEGCWTCMTEITQWQSFWLKNRKISHCSVH